jgi:hypothetical protein
MLNTCSAQASEEFLNMLILSNEVNEGISCGLSSNRILRAHGREKIF